VTERNSRSSPTTPVEAAAARLAQARRVVAYTGAGVSKESGISTFRDPGEGLWAKYDPLQLATADAYARDPAFVWRWYMDRFGLIERAAPNPGHRALAELERLVTLTVVTQNIDGLHQRAGSPDVIELHGSAHRFKCVGGRHTGFTLADFAGSDEAPPRCPRCGDLIRPDVVWFGEALPAAALERALDLAARCDVLIAVGTSGVVYPAALVPATAHESGAALIDVNPEPDALAAVADWFLQGPGGEVLPRLVAEVKRLRER
jgi:NAD-dependent deacetylase